MLKGSNTIKTLQNLSKHKFDTSGYVVLKDGVRREASTGQFLNTKGNSSPATSPRNKK